MDKSERAATGTQVGMISDVGRVRELNEDNLNWRRVADDLVLYAVADGMGGHDRGEVASQVAVETLFASMEERISGFESRDPKALRELLREVFQSANRGVVITGEEQESNMGTTLCCALVHDDELAYVANVGDSRVYLYRDDKLQPISQDHSLVAYLVQLGELSDEEARNHPSGNILVRSVGSSLEVEIDLFHLPVGHGDGLLLCSDGLWGELTDEELQDIIRTSPDAQSAAQGMVDSANDHGGRDNTTLILVRF